jgi:hypothetical protein
VNDAVPRGWPDVRDAAQVDGSIISDCRLHGAPLQPYAKSLGGPGGEVSTICQSALLFSQQKRPGVLTAASRSGND